MDVNPAPSKGGTGRFSWDGWKILIVEDEALIAFSLRLELVGSGFNVVGLAASGEQALEMVERHEPDLILMDVKLRGGLDGVAVAERIRVGRTMPIIFLSGTVDQGLRDRIGRLKGVAFLEKPVVVAAVDQAIHAALRA